MTLFFLTLRKELLAIKSIIISIFFIGISILIGKYSTSVAIIINAQGNSELIDLLFGVYGFLGYLFSSVLFSGLISKEVELQTMRYLTPYITRNKIYFSKYFASLTYFLIIVLFSLIVLFIYRGTIVLPFFSIISIILFFAYIQSLIMLVSTISKNDRTSILINFVISFILPILFILTYFKNWLILKIIQWFLPYYYLSKSWELLLLLLIILVINAVGYYLFSRKEI